MPPTQRKPRIAGLARALAVCAAAFAAGIAPPPIKTVSAWAAEKRMVSAESGSPFPGKWVNDRVPYLPEIMDVMSLSHPATEVTFLKSAQVAGTEAGLNLIGQVIDETPAPAMVVLPTIDEGKAYVRIKLQPTIDETPALATKVRVQKSRDEDGSTTRVQTVPRRVSCAHRREFLAWAADDLGAGADPRRDSEWPLRRRRPRRSDGSVARAHRCLERPREDHQYFDAGYQRRLPGHR